MSQQTGSSAWTATALAEAVRRHSISAVEATRSFLERIESLDGKLHAFQLVRADEALAEARAIDGRHDLAELPLAGVPVSIKDNFNVAGEPTRLGSTATPATPAGSDDEAVARLRQAGGVVIGKTTMPELAIFGFTESAAYGVTRNPWNLQRSPGGSTGGGAVAVMAGMAPLALGSDGLGSIRIPSTFCGAFGLKPTRKRLPLMGGLAEHWFGLSVTGSIASSVEDCALMLDVLGATNEFRGVAPPTTKLRIALSTKSPTVLAKLAPEIRDAVHASANALREAGHSIAETDPPYPMALANHLMRFWLAGVAWDAQNLSWKDLEKRTRTMARLGKRLGPASPNVLQTWTAIATEWFRDFDAALMPCVAQPSIRADGWSGRGFLSTVLSQIRAVPYTAAWNVAGFPAASVPAGIGPDGVPLSVQVVAPAGREAVILSIAAQLENLRPWPRLSTLAMSDTN